VVLVASSFATSLISAPALQKDFSFAPSHTGVFEKRKGVREAIILVGAKKKVKPSIL
jgi:hypothetical protein